MKLGAFSVSLAVKNIKASQAFYEKLGFEVTGGDINQNWLILRSEATVIGLFQGMFEKNLLTFNPGWNQQIEQLEEFDDVRQIQQSLKAQGLTCNPEVDEQGSGPGSFMVVDPDGNPILVDQHV